MRHKVVYVVTLCLVAMTVAFPYEAAAITTIGHTFNNPTYPAIRNSGFEADPALTQWYAPYGGWSRYSVSGLLSSKCAVGYSSQGDPTVLCQDLDLETRHAVSGHSIELTFWFRSGASDDFARAEVVYNGITVNGDWYYHSGTTSSPWVQAKVIVLNLPTTVSSLTVRIVGQDGAGGDLTTRVYVDEVKLSIVDRSTVNANQCKLGLVVNIEQIKNQTGSMRNFTLSVGFYGETQSYGGVQYYIYSAKITSELYPLTGSQTQQYKTNGGQTTWASLTIASFRQGNDAGLYVNPVQDTMLTNHLVDVAAAVVGLVVVGVFCAVTHTELLHAEVHAVYDGITHPLWSSVKDSLASYDQYAVNGDYRTLTKWNHNPPLLSGNYAKKGTFANVLNWVYPYPMVNHGGGGWYLKLTAVLEWGHRLPPSAPPYYWSLAYDGATTITTNIYCW